MLLGLDKVVDVPAIISNKSQQSMSFEKVEVLQLQFIDRMVDILVLCAETCTHSANFAVYWRGSTGAVLGQCLRLTSVVGFGSSPYLDTKHTIYELCLPSERSCPDSAAPLCCGGVCVAMSCGGRGFTRYGAYDFALDSVRAMTGKFTFNYFQYQEDVGCVCMLNGWFSSNDEICAENYIYSRFKLEGRSEKWELYLYGDKIIKVERVSVEVLPRGMPPPRFFTLLGNGSHSIFELCLPSERGMGMSMPLAVPVSSGSTAGCACPRLQLWNMPRCPSQSLWQEAPSMPLQLPCPRALRRQTALSLRLQCVARVLASPCRVMCDGGFFTPDGAVHGMTG